MYHSLRNGPYRSLGRGSAVSGTASREAPRCKVRHLIQRAFDVIGMGAMYICICMYIHGWFGGVVNAQKLPRSLVHLLVDFSNPDPSLSSGTFWLLACPQCVCTYKQTRSRG